MFFDTHAHYDDDQFDREWDTLIPEIHSAGVDLIMDPGSDLKSSVKAAAIAHRFDYVYAAAGIHPHYAGEADALALDGIRALIGNDANIRAVGEVGLDYFYDFTPRDVQKRFLYDQMQLSRETGLPVIMHERDACADCMDIVRAFPDVHGVFHCFSGSWETAKELLSRGWYLSFTGSITFKNARKSHEVITNMPEDRLMIETDSPYLAPVPVRGRRNDSRNLIHIAAMIAQLRGKSLEEIAEISQKNGKQFFSI